MRSNEFASITHQCASVVALILLWSLLHPDGSRAQILSSQPDTRFAITDGEVRALADGGDVIYLGGAFSCVGPYTGGWATLDWGTGERSPRWPLVHGKVTAMTPDGQGGWFIGGDFTRVGALPRQHMAHLLADGTVDPSWIVEVELPQGAPLSITAIAVLGDTVYFAGGFASVNGQTRNNLAATDATTGTVRSWDPAPTGQSPGGIGALAAHRGQIYAGGDFTRIGGAVRLGLAELDPNTGSATPLNLPVNGFVEVITPSDATLYLGGSFDAIGGKLRSSAAAVDLQTGTVLPWRTGVSDVLDIVVTPQRVYIAGRFSGGLSIVDPIWGLLVPLSTEFNGVGTSLALAGSTVIVGGYFLNLGGAEISYLAMLDAETSAVLDWQPRAGGIPGALAFSGGEVAVGGVSSFGGERRRNLAAVDKRTGEVTDWNPEVTDPVFARVWTLAVSGEKIVAGGSFTQVNGQAITNLVMFNRQGVETALVSPNSTVYALAVKDDTLYLGGGFSRCDGIVRRCLAAVNLGTGDLLDWNPDARRTSGATRVSALAAGPDGLFAGGTFVTIAGLARNYLAEIDYATGQPTAWTTAIPVNVTGGVDVLELAGNRLYVGGSISVTSANRRYDKIMSFDANTGAVDSFPTLALAQVLLEPESLAVIDDELVFGGFPKVGSQTQSGLRQVSRTTGDLAGWNPQSDEPAFALLWDGEALYAGGSFSTAGGESLQGLAVFLRLQQAPSIVMASVRFAAFTGLSFEVSATPGRQFAIESSEDFTLWQELEVRTATAGRTEFSDLRPVGSARYYRVSPR